MRVLVIAAFAILAIPAQKLTIGVVGGTNLTDDFRSYSSYTILEGQRYNWDANGGKRHFLFGPMIEFGLPKGFAVEANAYRRLLQTHSSVDPPLPASYRFNPVISMTTWQFPLLLKYRLPQLGVLRPFLAGGPSFRVHGAPIVPRPSRIGTTLGAGIELRRGRFAVSPTVRYTRWAYGERRPGRQQQNIRDQMEFLVGFHYTTEAPQRRVAGRRMWFGLVAGVPLLNDFRPLEGDSPGYSGGNSRIADIPFVGGLMGEAPIRGDHLSLEVNALYRRLHFPYSPDVVVTWQFPVLAKYTFTDPGRRLRPFVAGGPSFRLSGNLNHTSPSHFGFTGAAGFETKYKWLRLTPAMRYTRWREDYRTTSANQRRTKLDQLELVTGISF